MKHFRKIWSAEINAFLISTKGIKPGDAWQLFLKTYPNITDVTKTAFLNQRSRVGAAGVCRNPGITREPRPLWSEHTKKGYVRIKIAQPNVWVSKAKWVYMETHPEEWEEIKNEGRTNYIFLDGNNRNFHPDNIARVPINLMGVFNSLGGTVDGHPELTRLRLAEAKLKVKILDKLEEQGKTANYNGYRADRAKRHEYYLKQKAKPDYKEKCRIYAKTYFEKMKKERPEVYQAYRKKCRERYQKKKNISK